MNVTVFSHFMKVVEAGSISKAAAILGTSQPSLTKAIGELEAELGTKLLYRDGHGVRLTKDGVKFCSWAGEINAVLQGMRTDLIGQPDPLRKKQVSVGVLPSVARSFSVDLKHSLEQTYPNAAIRILEGVTGHLIEWLKDQRVDVAIFHDTAAAAELNPQPLISHSMYLISGPSKALGQCEIGFAALDGLPLILTSRQVGNRRDFESRAKSSGISLQVVIEVDSLHAMIQLVAEGVGHTILPLFAVYRELAEQRLTASKLIEPTLNRTLVIASQSKHTPLAGFHELAQDMRHRITTAMKQTN